MRDLRRRPGSAPARALFETMTGTFGPADHAEGAVQPVPDRVIRRLQLDQSARQCAQSRLAETLPHGGRPQAELMTLVAAVTLKLA
jgi:hypothetical protein